ncbi:DUF4340 domain-containing protein [bacterium]|nr:DUF4340 domain-containing protein [bacterium]
MNIKTTLVLLLAALLGLAGIFGYRKYQEMKEAQKRHLGAKIYENYPVNDIARITIRDNSAETVLEREGSHWLVKDGSNFRARYSSLAELLANIYDMRSGQEINVRRSGYQQLKVADPEDVTTNSGQLVETFLPDGTKASSFIVGRTKARSMEEMSGRGAFDPGDYFVGQYVRLKGEEKPMLIKNIFRITPKPEFWRDTTVMSLKKDDVTSLEGPDYALSGEDGDLTLPGGEKPNSGVLMRLLEPMVNLNAKSASLETKETKDVLKVRLKSGLCYTLCGLGEDGSPCYLTVKASFAAPDRGTNEVTSAEKALDLKTADEAEQYNQWFGRFLYEIEKGTYKKLFINKEILTQPEKAEEGSEEDGVKKRTPFDDMEEVEDA